MNLFRFLFCVVLFGMLGLVIVWQQIDQVQAGYRIQSKESQLRSHQEEIRTLEIRRQVALKSEVLKARASQYGLELVDLVAPPPEPMVNF